MPRSLYAIVDQLVPELERRGLRPREYLGATTRQNLGLPEPENQFFPEAAH